MAAVCLLGALPRYSGYLILPIGQALCHFDLRAALCTYRIHAITNGLAWYGRGFIGVFCYYRGRERSYHNSPPAPCVFCITRHAVPLLNVAAAAGDVGWDIVGAMQVAVLMVYFAGPRGFCMGGHMLDMGDVEGCWLA
eukprot:CAMPEP_0202863572 /NCGR_PEP_ID=MMETSP1391-20130828/4150_1 /ASSEMBLY_ACC=CAM_ASM_000867 /TAXON_ID=1034604 /ORGANISM="Chlamydomonas leiostraca, Strain SAG 11-49" /LENGTH=137 /DNA_ID=CAMNT_0049543219 /DNA_START=762 /DNA_END=1175 /DNA_ORIENTATION=+